MNGRRLRAAMCVGLLCAAGGEASEPTLMHRDLDNLRQRRTLGLVGLGIGAALLAHPFDDDLEGEIGNPQPLRTLMDAGDYYGGTTWALLATGGLWTAARLAGSDRLRPVASEALRAVTLANVLVSPLKVAVARERPDGSNGLSFPSGHSANSFALTAVLTRRYGWRLGVPLYALTAAVPMARLHGDKHFFSDVVGGAIIGTAAGLAVTPGDAARLSVAPTRVDGAPALVARWSL